MSREVADAQRTRATQRRGEREVEPTVVETGNGLRGEHFGHTTIREFLAVQPRGAHVEVLERGARRAALENGDACVREQPTETGGNYTAGRASADDDEVGGRHVARDGG